MTHHDTPIKILWTGGWDSTFRVLYVLIVEKRAVEPYYILDHLRPSTLHELRTLGRIKRCLNREYPEAASNLGRVHVTAKCDIPENDSITAAWKEIRTRIDIAVQYDWLARWAESHNICGLELCVEKSGGIYDVLTDKIPGRDLFSRFNFPVLGYTKSDMRRLAEEHHFLAILELSWFCHRPILGRPCGFCSPCIAVVRHGLAYRISMAGMIRYNMARIARAAYRFVRQLVAIS